VAGPAQGRADPAVALSRCGQPRDRVSTPCAAARGAASTCRSVRLACRSGPLAGCRPRRSCNFARARAASLCPAVSHPVRAISSPPAARRAEAAGPPGAQPAASIAARTARASDASSDSAAQSCGRDCRWPSHSQAKDHRCAPSADNWCSAASVVPDVSPHSAAVRALAVCARWAAQPDEHSRSAVARALDECALSVAS
jgi:hypothetical protein